MEYTNEEVADAMEYQSNWIHEHSLSDARSLYGREPTED